MKNNLLRKIHQKHRTSYSDFASARSGPESHGHNGMEWITLSIDFLPIFEDVWIFVKVLEVDISLSVVHF
jgi:hypothetical protein